LTGAGGQPTWEHADRPKRHVNTPQNKSAMRKILATTFDYRAHEDQTDVPDGSAGMSTWHEEPPQAKRRPPGCSGHKSMLVKKTVFNQDSSDAGEAYNGSFNGMAGAISTMATEEWKRGKHGLPGGAPNQRSVIEKVVFNADGGNFHMDQLAGDNVAFEGMAGRSAWVDPSDLWGRLAKGTLSDKQVKRPQQRDPFASHRSRLSTVEPYRPIKKYMNFGPAHETEIAAAAFCRTETEVEGKPPPIKHTGFVHPPSKVPVAGSSSHKLGLFKMKEAGSLQGDEVAQMAKAASGNAKKDHLGGHGVQRCLTMMQHSASAK